MPQFCMTHIIRPDKVSFTDLKDQIKTKPDVDIKPEVKHAPVMARKYFIATAQARFPLVPRKTVQVSTFTPTSFNYHQVVHYMDQLMIDN